MELLQLSSSIKNFLIVKILDCFCHRALIMNQPMLVYIKVYVAKTNQQIHSKNIFLKLQKKKTKVQFFWNIYTFEKNFKANGWQSYIK